jgi:hypothetical protein
MNAIRYCITRGGATPDKYSASNSSRISDQFLSFSYLNKKIYDILDMCMKEIKQ